MNGVPKITQWLAAAIVVLLVLVGGAWYSSQFWPRKTADAAKVPPTDPLLPTSPVSRPATPPAGYVGSAICATCHEDFCKSFARHPMGRSSALTPGPADIENYSEEKAVFSAADGTRYKAEKLGDKVLHHEIGTDAQGRTLYDLSVPVSLAIGSGTRGKTYGINRDGILLQSPISWYSAKGGYFELSPGYENIATNPRFSRRMIEECLNCHVGRMEFDPETPDKLLSPYFQEVAIGCERCHGPGDKHVQLQQAGKTPSPDPTIVNPVRLPMRERESVCYQCHLHGDFRDLRYGRRPRDFRPGMQLEEVFCVLVKDESAGGAAKAVSQVEQMRESACFQANPQKLGCISCHNPHEWPEPQQQDAYYRARCNECHADHGCSLPANRREARGNSCIACHMPRGTPKDVAHASQTDHRVLKEPQPGVDTEPSAAGSFEDLKFFDESDKRLPAWEVQRTRGMVLARHNVSDNPQKALALLLPLAAVAPDDVPLLTAIGTAYLNRKSYAESRKWLEKAVALEPKNEHAQTLLAQICSEIKDYAAAKAHIGIVVNLNPFVARNFVIQARILAESGEYEQARQSVEKVLELDPTQTSLREWLLKLGHNE